MIGRLIAKSEMNMGERNWVALQLVSLQEPRLENPFPSLPH